MKAASRPRLPHLTRSIRPGSPLARRGAMPGLSRPRGALAPRAATGALLRCSAVAALYDLMLMLDPAAPEGRDEEILGDVRSMIEAGGNIVGEHDWGVRRMTFEINHQPEAAYHLLQFEGDNALLERIGHTLKITDGVLRHRVIRLKPGSPPPPTPRPDAGRRREEGRPEGAAPVAARAAADAPARG